MKSRAEVVIIGKSSSLKNFNADLNSLCATVRSPFANATSPRARTTNARLLPSCHWTGFYFNPARTVSACSRRPDCTAMITKNARFCPHRSPPTQCAVSVAPARPRKQAMSPDALREHARRVKMPADEILSWVWWVWGQSTQHAFKRLAILAPSISRA